MNTVVLILIALSVLPALAWAALAIPAAGSKPSYWSPAAEHFTIRAAFTLVLAALVVAIVGELVS